MAQADILRKAMGKKSAAVMEAQREKFVTGCVGNKVAETNAITKTDARPLRGSADHSISRATKATRSAGPAAGCRRESKRLERARPGSQPPGNAETSPRLAKFPSGLL